MAEVLRCKSENCAAMIVFARLMSTGNPHPFNLPPALGGGWMLQTDLFGDLVAEHVPEGLRDGPLFVSHFATCVDAPAWRRASPT